MPDERHSVRPTDVADALLGIALTCVCYVLFRKLTSEHALLGVPALVVLALLSLNVIKTHGGRGFTCYLVAVGATALLLRVTVGAAL